MSEPTTGRCCDGEFCGAWDSCREAQAAKAEPARPAAEAELREANARRLAWFSDDELLAEIERRRP